MPALLSPQPLLPAFQIIESTPSVYYTKKSYTRLRSPSLSSDAPAIRTLESFQPLQSLSQPSCTTTPRRRSKTPQRSHRLRRLASRVDYRREQSPLHAFDKLPWIASLDVPPGSNRPCPDIADLSLMPDPVLPKFGPSGPGPIRRRKVSLRSSPVLPSSSDTPSLDDHLVHSILFPRDSPTRPSTPSSRFDPSRVIFRDLMPVIDDHP